ncbi:EF-hand domain-containing protein [Aquicoccus sp. G2-2]|jgi:Ca2+-binding EF-hand superfamily protein|uniref:EF-hand domain-containing protein n=1 Tax=Aquicoccus sp. G2-2 TaxID=3092120 RepID=UPI002AE037FE|nr:EF-hand domain-containing protein [Aquicoccus sp. G2-2]MEA1113786.1 EF-hand domain-containing protein [Aquicoccus sp. G2-2]
MKRTYLIAGISALGILAGTGVVFAQAQHDRHGQRGGMEMMMFKQADTNGDGKVTSEEMEAAAKARFAAADSDGNGKLSADEMQAASLKRQEERRQARAERMAAKMIKKMDSDGDGELSFDEMPGQKTASQKMFDRLDSDHDGAVSEAEMKAARERMHQHMKERRDHDGKRHHSGRKGQHD